MSKIRAISYKETISGYKLNKNKTTNAICFGREAVPVMNAAKSGAAVVAASSVLVKSRGALLYRNFEMIVQNVTKVLVKKSNKFFASLKKTSTKLPEFFEDEKVIIAKYKKHRDSEDKIFAILQGHGLNDESVKYIKDTSSLMQAKSKSAMSLRDHLKIALEKEKPLEVIEDLLTRSANYRKIWRLDNVPKKNNTELANLLLNRKPGN